MSIKEIKLNNFKCFKNIKLNLNNLTVLSGLNSSGKSTVIQSIVLLHQSLLKNMEGNKIYLNGSELQLGSIRDVLCDYSDNQDSISISLKIQEKNICWIFNTNNRDALSMLISKIELNQKELPINSQFKCLLPIIIYEEIPEIQILKNIIWISAERLAPQEIFILLDDEEQINLGSKGEFAPSVFHHRKEEKIKDDLCILEEPNTLFKQVNAYMSRLFYKIQFDSSDINATKIALKIKSVNKTIKPQNNGFGISQVFPIIVALLTATNKNLLIIENPEVHLHPKAQQELGQLIAKVASTGVQIILETHSDHILNGIRLAVKQKKINNEMVQFHFFDYLSEDNTYKCVSPSIDESGKINQWPKGFFDQIEEALLNLI